MAAMDDNNSWYATRNPAVRQHADRQFESVRRDAVTALSGVLAGFWGDIEEQVRLAAIASHENRAIYDDRLAIQLLNQRALELASRYRETLEQAFDRWRNPRPRSIENKGLSLMSESELEIHLAGQQVVELLEQQLMHPLHRSNECFNGLGVGLGLPKQGPEANPLRPEVPINALVKLTSEHDLTPELRRLIFLQLEKRLSKTLGELYDKINVALENTIASREQVSMPAQVSMPPQMSPMAGWTPDGGLVDPRTMAPMQGYAGAVPPAGTWGVPGSPMPGAQMSSGAMPSALASSGMMSDPGHHGFRYREAIHQQIRAWRRSALGPGAAGAAQAPSNARMLAPQELFGIATVLQGNDPAPYVRALAGDDARPLSAVIRAQIASGSRQLGYDPTQMRFNEIDEDAIDLVAILLQTLSRSHATVQRSRTMYGRLVVPYLKLALSDKALFD